MGIAKNELKLARQAFIDSRTDVEKYGAALDKLKSAAKQGAFKDDPRQYARALAALKEQLDPATIAQRQLDKATTETALRIRDHLHPGMRQYREDIRAAKQALDAGKISQAEYTAEKRRLASLLPQVQARQREHTAAVARGTTIVEGMRWLSKRENIGQIAKAMDTLASTAEGVSTVVLSVASAFSEMDDETRTLVSTTAQIGGTLVQVATAGGSTIAVTGQLVTWYRTLQTTAAGARVSQLALNTAVGAGYVAAAGAALVAGYAIGTMLINQTQWAKDAAKAYDEYAAGVKSLQSREAKEREDTLARIKAAPQAQRGSMLQTEMAMAQKQLEGLTGRAEMAKKEMDRLQPSWLSLGQAGKKIWQAQAAEYEALKTRAAEAGRWINTLEDEMRNGVQQPLLTPGMPPPAVAAGATPTAEKTLQQETNELVNALEQQIREVGKTDEEVALLRLQARGLGDDWVRTIRLMQGELAAKKQAAEANAELQRLAKSLQEQQWAAQLAAAGYSEAQIQLAKLANQGADPRLVAQTAALQQQAEVAQRATDATAELTRLAKSLQEQRWAAQLAAAGYSEAQIQLAKLANQGADPRLVAQTAALQHETDLQIALTETIKRLKEKAATAGMTAEQLELYRLKNLGATDAQLAQVAALQQQSRSQREATQSQKDAIASTKDWQAATRGSAEALDRIEAYRRMVGTGAAKQAATRGSAVATGAAKAIPINLVGPPVVNEGPPRSRRPAAEPTTPKEQSVNALLGQAVRLLDRIARATDREPITVEQTA